MTTSKDSSETAEETLDATRKKGSLQRMAGAIFGIIRDKKNRLWVVTLGMVAVFYLAWLIPFMMRPIYFEGLGVVYKERGMASSHIELFFNKRYPPGSKFELLQKDVEASGGRCKTWMPEEPKKSLWAQNWDQSRSEPEQKKHYFCWYETGTFAVKRNDVLRIEIVAGENGRIQTIKQSYHAREDD